MSNQLPTSNVPDWQIGQTRHVASKTDPSAKSYVVTRTKDTAYECTCWAFITQNKGRAKDKKTCKHLRDVLGDAYENARTGTAPKSPSNKRRAPKAQIASSSKSTSSDHPRASNFDHISSAKKPRLDATTSGGDSQQKAGLSTSAQSQTRAGQPADLLLAHSFEFGGKRDPTGMLMSEKLDGVRAYWDGQGTLWSRTKKSFAAPKAFITQLPQDVTLDGELYIGRDRFDETSGLVRTTRADVDTDRRWESIKYMVFDMPCLGSKPFTERLAKLHEIFPPGSPGPVIVVEHEACKNLEHLQTRLNDIIHEDAEGLMLRDPHSLYVGKRHKSLLKVKTFYDAEARVVDYEPGKGKYEGMVGSLICVMESGKQFLVGSGMNDARRANPPPVGAIISYRFQELSQNNVPRFPTFVGERHDVEGPKDAVVRSTTTRAQKVADSSLSAIKPVTPARKSKSKAKARSAIEGDD